MQSTSSIDTATTASSSSTTTSTGDDKYTIDDTKHLVHALLMVPTSSNVSVEMPPIPTIFAPNKLKRQHQETVVNKATFALHPRKRERGHLAIATEIMDEMNAMDLHEDNSYVNMDAEPDLLEQSFTKLLQPRKKERHYMSIADDILRDFDTDDDDDEYMY